jgi:hypothetical protein
VLVDREGAIRARLAPHAAQEARHPVIDGALSSTGAYVEHYGALDFVSDAQSLVYAWRMEDTAKRPLGVLVLVFRLADEMAGIFRKLLPEQDWTVLGCVSPSGDVIAGSCPIQLPAGLKLSPAALQGAEPVIRLGGRQYLAMACRTSGYQGYVGPGWLGLGLIPLEAAFDQDDGELEKGIGEDLLLDLVPVRQVGGVDGDRPDARCGRGRDLVAHEREQRRHHQRGAGTLLTQQRGGDPVHRRLAPAGGLHQQDAALVGDQGIDGGQLVGPQAGGGPRQSDQHLCTCSGELVSGRRQVTRRRRHGHWTIVAPGTDSVSGSRNPVLGWTTHHGRHGVGFRRVSDR